MDDNNLEAEEDPAAEAALVGGGPVHPASGPWSQRSISRSLQRAEGLLRSTFHPSLKWLFRSHSHNEEEEEHFVAAHNLVSRSSARLVRLQQALLTVPPQWLVAETQPGSAQGLCKAVWRLVLQRSLLLFTHESSRRVRLAAEFVSRVDRLLDRQLDHLRKTPQSLGQVLSMLSSLATNLGSLCQELRIHLNHWPRLFSRVQSDACLRLALVHQAGLVMEIRQNLDSLSLQALVLMERYVHCVLCAVAHVDLDSVPAEVLEDILTGTDLFNQAVEERRTQQTVSQQAHCLRSTFGPTKSPALRPSAFSVNELLRILAVHHAGMAARQLSRWASEQSSGTCDGCCVAGRGSWCRPGVSWEQPASVSLCPPCSTNRLSLLAPSPQTSPEARPFSISDLHCDCRTLTRRPEVDRPPSPARQPGRGDPTRPWPTDAAQLSCSSVEVQRPLPQHTTASAPPPPTHRQAPPPSQVCRDQQLAVEKLFQLLISSSNRSPHRCAAEAPPELHAAGAADAVSSAVRDVSDAVDSTEGSSTPNEDEDARRRKQDGLDTEASGSECEDSSRVQPPAAGGGWAEQGDDPRWPHSVRWSDLGRPLVLGDLMNQYRALLRSLCREAVGLQLLVPPAGGTADSMNLQDIHRTFRTLSCIHQAVHTGQLSEECKAMLVDFSEYLLIITAHAHWDHVLCSSLGSALRDKCVVAGGRKLLKSSSEEEEGRETTSLTMRHFLLLPPPLLSALRCHQPDRRASGAAGPPPSCTLRGRTVSLVLASVQLSTVWVVSKAFQFLSSWSLNKFLLITQGDLKMLKKSFQLLIRQTSSLVLASDGEPCSALQNHTQQLLRQQLGKLDGSASELQTFCSRVLKSFSRDCKRMSGEIFERTMPPAVHWRPGRTGFPNSPSEYASSAAQAVIGQVLEGVASLPDDVRLQALSVTMTAFMEAWMEHILRQKIKFSIQGALQLKQDFDCIREMIQADRYGLSADLHQHLLSLCVFQQVDSAVVCLLQQPQAKSSLHSRAWEPLVHCCPPAASRDSLDAAVNSSITNLHCVEGAELPAALPAVAPSTPAEPYLAPSVSLGASQQQWLDLRLQNSARRWRLPGLQCLSSYEP